MGPCEQTAGCRVHASKDDSSSTVPPLKGDLLRLCDEEGCIHFAAKVERGAARRPCMACLNFFFSEDPFLDFDYGDRHLQDKPTLE